MAIVEAPPFSGRVYTASSGVSGDSSATSDVMESEMLSLFSGSPSRATS